MSKLIALFTVAVVACAVSAQPLADLVPSDAAVYVGWSGTRDGGAGFEGSKFKAVLDAANVAELVRTGVDAGRAQAAEQGDEELRGFELLVTIANLSWTYESALAFRGLGELPSGEPMPRLTAMWRCGADAPAIKDRLASLVAFLAEEEPDAHVRVEQLNDVVVLSAGIVHPMLAEDRAAIATHEPFTRALAAAGTAKPNAVLYVDFDAISAMLAKAAMKGPKGENFPAAWNALGFDGVHRMAVTGAYQDTDWATAMFIDAPAPRRGALTMFETGVLDPKALGVVPATATWASSFGLDLSGVLDLIRNVIKITEPDELADFEKGLRKGSEEIGFDIENDLLKSLGSTYVIYGDPAVAGNAGMGFCAVSELRDAAKVAHALERLVAKVNQELAEGQQANPMFRGVEQIRMGEVSIYTMPIFMFAAPSWAVHEGRLYVGLFPQAVSMGVEYAAGALAQPITGNPKYTQVMVRLGDRPAHSVMYLDLPQTAPQTYQTWMMLTQFLSSMTAGAPGEARPMAMLPPLGKILPHLAPAGQVAWADDAGWHMRGISPFPGSTFLSPNMNASTVGASAMGVGILLPALGAARRTAIAAKTQTQARGIVQNAVVYAASHQDQMPPNLQALLENDLLPELLVTDNDNPIPGEVLASSIEEQARWLEQHGSFVILVYGAPNDFDTTKVAVFEKFKPAARRIAIAFRDGHAESHPPEEARRIIEASTGKTIEELGGWAGEPSEPEFDEDAGGE